MLLILWPAPSLVIGVSLARDECYTTESCWITFTTSCCGNQTLCTAFPQHIATHQRSTHPLQAGDIHFIATSPFTARQPLMFGSPVEFHLVFR